ncbi:MAG: hypothetical protein HYT12_02380 [Candidatus Liptonbacteria bacterium]|nr:hypothetical protein [Candidatus Liptonbacteria bacterium]
MPYVPSKKTDGKSTDREVIDAALEPLARSVAAEITNNFSLRKIYGRVFVGVAGNLRDILADPNLVGVEPEWHLAMAIYETGAKYGYEGAYLGEFNYAITRFIQLVPQFKVERGDWEKKNELRYWLYAETVSALRAAENSVEAYNIGLDGVFRDIKDEYKWEVNRSYEIAQILKSGHCYTTPFYSRPVELVDEDDKHIGYLEIPLERTPETLNVDILPYKLVLKKK